MKKSIGIIIEINKPKIIVFADAYINFKSPIDIAKLKAMFGPNSGGAITIAPIKIARLFCISQLLQL